MTLTVGENSSYSCKYQSFFDFELKYYEQITKYFHRLLFSLWSTLKFQKIDLENINFEKIQI